MTEFALDSSVLVPGIHAQTLSHDTCRPLLERATLSLQAVWMETLATLTRLPGGLSLTTDAALRALHADCPPRIVGLDSRNFQRACRELAQAGIAGGQLYDGLIALCARDHEAVLLTRDRRAIPTYTAVGVQFEIVRD